MISNTPKRMIFAATVDIYIEIRNGLKIKARFFSQHCFIIKIVFMTYFASLNTKCNKYLLCKQNPKCYSKLASWEISKLNINHEMQKRLVFIQSLKILKTEEGEPNIIGHHQGFVYLSRLPKANSKVKSQLLEKLKFEAI